MNTTHLTLLWSPPFLWPGERINYYNVFFTTKGECAHTEYRQKSNYSDQIVSLTVNHNEAQMCTEFELFVSAIDTDSSVLQVFNVTGLIMPSSKNHFLQIENVYSQFYHNNTQYHRYNWNWISQDYQYQCLFCC